MQMIWKWLITFFAFLPPVFRRNGEGNVFTGVCPFTFAGLSPSRRGVSFLRAPILSEGGTPSQVLMGGYPLPRSGWGGGGGYPPVQMGGVPPSQVRMGIIPPMSRPGKGVPPPPCPDLGRWYIPVQTWEGGTPSPIQVRSQDGGYPQPEQHSVYLLRGGRCASCVYSGGLSCFTVYSSKWRSLRENTQLSKLL